MTKPPTMAGRLECSACALSLAKEHMTSLAKRGETTASGILFLAWSVQRSHCENAVAAFGQNAHVTTPLGYVDEGRPTSAK